ncbi:uncharacterized protein LOC106673386 [Cimex lectularius]|uniref:YDG domain-containing protein n=1 Tax=Cimex lectularius TaxID=79782 RepID=A0A8I6SCU6_CIMLE|nr:uncharacterized protein LOC106673386 [Cimex lectularius]XP_014260969.1 uncharacterized protein LOC106673386 [Cimex lectularius]
MEYAPPRKSGEVSVSGAVTPRRTRRRKNICSFYGPPEGVPIGTIFESRRDLSLAGVHRPLKGTLDISQHGIVSVLVTDDSFIVDSWKRVVYQAPLVKNNRKDRSRSDIKGFWSSYLTKFPIRLTRSFNHKGGLGPIQGYRYDGLFNVTRSWKCIVDSDWVCHRFELFYDLEIQKDIPAPSKSLRSFGGANANLDEGTNIAGKDCYFSRYRIQGRNNDLKGANDRLIYREVPDSDDLCETFYHLTRDQQRQETEDHIDCKEENLSDREENLSDREENLSDWEEESEIVIEENYSLVKSETFPIPNTIKIESLVSAEISELTPIKDPETVEQPSLEESEEGTLIQGYTLDSELWKEEVQEDNSDIDISDENSNDIVYFNIGGEEISVPVIFKKPSSEGSTDEQKENVSESDDLLNSIEDQEVNILNLSVDDLEDIAGLQEEEIIVAISVDDKLEDPIGTNDACEINLLKEEFCGGASTSNEKREFPPEENLTCLKSLQEKCQSIDCYNESKKRFRDWTGEEHILNKLEEKYRSIIRVFIHWKYLKELERKNCKVSQEKVMDESLMEANFNDFPSLLDEDYSSQTSKFAVFNQSDENIPNTDELIQDLAVEDEEVLTFPIYHSLPAEGCITEGQRCVYDMTFREVMNLITNQTSCPCSWHDKFPLLAQEMKSLASFIIGNEDKNDSKLVNASKSSSHLLEVIKNIMEEKKPVLENKLIQKSLNNKKIKTNRQENEYVPQNEWDELHSNVPFRDQCFGLNANKKSFEDLLSELLNDLKAIIKNEAPLLCEKNCRGKLKMPSKKNRKRGQAVVSYTPPTSPEDFLGFTGRSIDQSDWNRTVHDSFAQEDTFLGWDKNKISKIRLTQHKQFLCKRSDNNNN